MSQKDHEPSNPRADVTPPRKPPPPPIEGLSPDDGVGVSSEDTGKKPPPRK